MPDGRCRAADALYPHFFRAFQPGALFFPEAHSNRNCCYQAVPPGYGGGFGLCPGTRETARKKDRSRHCARAGGRAPGTGRKRAAGAKAPSHAKSSAAGYQAGCSELAGNRGRPAKSGQQFSAESTFKHWG